MRANMAACLHPYIKHIYKTFIFQLKNIILRGLEDFFKIKLLYYSQIHLCGLDSTLAIHRSIDCIHYNLIVAVINFPGSRQYAHII